jgi:oligo-1,6-glucosidase
MTHDTKQCWKNSVVYQIYPRSFCDSNGDGVGDLKGITSKLDYLQSLGVGVIWLSPIYQSPNDDNGYDISDYRAIHPDFGTMADFDEMLSGMHRRGIKLMMDLVVNHTSDDHLWFKQARSSRDNPFHDYYIWSDPVDQREPTNWESAFNGSAWELNEPTGQYFLHMFSKRQPDLNWENPKVRAEVHALMRFWLDKGVDGFRMDVINMISKPWDSRGHLPDAPVCRPGFIQPGFNMTVNGPRLQEFLLEMKQEVLSHYESITVGEAPGANPEVALAITDQDTGALNMLFQFDHVSLDAQPGKSKWDLKPLDLLDLKRSLSEWQTHLSERGWNSLYLNNHDQPRALSRYGDDTHYRAESAKLLALLIHGMKGTPYVYQGEEIGMTNFPFEHIEQCQDIETLNMYREAVREQGKSASEVMHAIRIKGRDNARTPMQWSSAVQAGFTTGKPWLAVNPNHTSINVEAELANPDSVFHFYKRLIELRRELPVLVHGKYQLFLEDHPQIFAYSRTLGNEVLLMLCNLSRNPAIFGLPSELDISSGTLLLSSVSDDLHKETASRVLKPYEARMYALARGPIRSAA